MSLRVLLLWLLLLAPALAQETLNLDGVAIGMSYEQVLRVRGLPQALRVDDQLTYLVYAAPPGRREGTSVWFFHHKVVFAGGYDLLAGQEPVFLYGMEGPVLQDALGAPEPLNVFSRWFPDSGVVLTGYNNQWPLETVTSPLGLRDTNYPLDWYESSPGCRWSRSEPWADDEIKIWLAEDVELGMAEEKARKLAGGQEVEYQGGFVRAVHHPAEALLSHRLGYHDLSTEFLIGEAPVALGAGANDLPLQGWYTPSTGGRVRMDAGKVVEIELRLENDELFAALERYVARP